LPPGFRPVWVAGRVGAREPTFDAVAAPDPLAWELHLLPWDKRDANFDEMKGKGFGPALSCVYTAGDDPAGEATVWVRDGPDWGNWIDDDQRIDRRMRQGRKDGLRPVHLSAARVDGEIEYEVVMREKPPAEWEAHRKLTAADLAARVAEFRAKGWQPDGVTAYRDGDRVLFNAVFVENKPAVGWDFRAGLTVAEYEKELTSPARSGQRPLSVASVAAGGAVEYTVVWIDAP
jgi:hypothetical protein